MRKTNEKFLIFCDLDSTLLTKDKKIPFSTILFIKKLVRNGSMFVINTGRPLVGTLKFIKKLNISSPIIVDNGATIIYKDKIVGEYIPKKDAINLFNDLKNYINCSFIESSNYMYFYNENEVPFWMVHNSRISKRTKIIEKGLNSLQEDIHDGYFEFYTVHKNKIEEIIKNYHTIDFYYYKKNDELSTYTIYKKGITKGTATLNVIKELDFKKKNTIAFGDAHWDIPMLENVNHSVAMINGNNDVKKITKYITKYDNNHKGVERFLKTLIKNSQG